MFGFGRSPSGKPLFVAVAVALLGCGCAPPAKLSGDAVGQYSVRGTLVETSCGEGHAAPGQFWFHVELRDGPDPVGYWKLPDGPIMNGALDDASFRFASSETRVGVAAQPELGVVGCVVEREEIVEGTFGSAASPTDAATLDASQITDAGADGSAPEAGAADASAPEDDEAAFAAFTGHTTVRITATPGSDCAALLVPQGGAFPALPCEIHYSLVGERLEEPLW